MGTLDLSQYSFAYRTIPFLHSARRGITSISDVPDASLLHPEQVFDRPAEWLTWGGSYITVIAWTVVAILHGVCNSANDLNS